MSVWTRLSNVVLVISEITDTVSESINDRLIVSSGLNIQTWVVGGSRNWLHSKCEEHGLKKQLAAIHALLSAKRYSSTLNVTSHASENISVLYAAVIFLDRVALASLSTQSVLATR